MPDGTTVQRDLYSAFLIQNVDGTLKSVDRSLCEQSYQQFLRLHTQEIERLSEIATPSSTGIRCIA